MSETTAIQCCRDECCGPGSWCCSHANEGHDCAGRNPYKMTPEQIRVRNEAPPAGRSNGREQAVQEAKEHGKRMAEKVAHARRTSADSGSTEDRP